jgi:hypothetical protein
VRCCCSKPRSIRYATGSMSRVTSTINPFQSERRLRSSFVYVRAGTQRIRGALFIPRDIFKFQLPKTAGRYCRFCRDWRNGQHLISRSGEKSPTVGKGPDEYDSRRNFFSRLLQLTFIRDSPRVPPVFPSFRPCLQETWKAATKIARPPRFAFNARVRGSKGISLFRKLEQRNGSSNI